LRLFEYEAAGHCPGRFLRLTERGWAKVVDVVSCLKDLKEM